jgi:hypothetical protein
MENKSVRFWTRDGTKADRGDEPKEEKNKQAYTLFLTKFRIACLKGITLQFL